MVLIRQHNGWDVAVSARWCFRIRGFGPVMHRASGFTGGVGVVGWAFGSWFRRRRSLLKMMQA